MEGFFQHNWATIVACCAALWAFWKADFFPWLKTRAAQDRQTQSSLTDRLFQVLDRQVQAMDDTGKLIRDMAGVLQSVFSALSTANAAMVAKHEITHLALRDILARLDILDADVNDSKEILTTIATAQHLVSRRKAARIKPAGDGAAPPDGPSGPPLKPL